MTDLEKALIEDMSHMEEACERTVKRCDVWQDRIIYWMAVSVLHLLQIEYKRRTKHDS